MIYDAARQLNFGLLMRWQREKRGISARQLSSLAGLSPSYVTKMEKSELIPRVDTFLKMAKVLGLNDDEILFLLHSAIV